MTSVITKPRFEEVTGITTTPIVGPISFADMRDKAYDAGFRMSTMSELVSLVYASFENPEYETAKNVIKIFKNEWVPANTGVYYSPQGMFALDNPEMENKKIIPFDYKALESKLGKHEEKGVIFSDDKTLRFTPYGFKIGSQNSVELAKNRGIIALVNGEENADRLAIASQHYNVNPVLFTFSDFTKLKNNIKIACIGTDTLEDWINIGAVDGENDGNYWGSYMVPEMNMKKAE
jgi:hypothetical protein